MIYVTQTLIGDGFLVRTVFTSSLPASHFDRTDLPSLPNIQLQLDSRDRPGVYPAV